MKVALVTGASRGIGQAIATDFASKGGNICLMDVNAESLKDTENAIVNKHGVKVISCVVDVTSKVNVEDAFKRVHDTFGRIDVLVQCAGITGITNVNTHEVDVANFDLVYKINVNINVFWLNGKIKESGLKEPRSFPYYYI